jgi:hypothetical protein
LSFEEFGYLIGLLEFLSGLIFGFFFFIFELSESLCRDLTSESLRDEHVASLCTRYFDDLSFVSDMSDIDEELYGEEIGRHERSISNFFILRNIFI